MKWKMRSCLFFLLWLIVLFVCKKDFTSYTNTVAYIAQVFQQNSHVRVCAMQCVVCWSSAVEVDDRNAADVMMTMMMQSCIHFIFINPHIFSKYCCGCGKAAEKIVCSCNDLQFTCVYTCILIIGTAKNSNETKITCIQACLLIAIFFSLSLSSSLLTAEHRENVQCKNKICSSWPSRPVDAMMVVCFLYVQKIMNKMVPHPFITAFIIVILFFFTYITSHNNTMCNPFLHFPLLFFYLFFTSQWYVLVQHCVWIHESV